MSRELITPAHMRELYLATEIWIAIDGELLPAAEAVAHLGSPIFVFAGWDPASKMESSAESAAINREIGGALDDLEAEHFEAFGETTNNTHLEQCVAAKGIGRKRARELGRWLGQDAIFELTADEQIVHGCSSSWSRRRPIIAFESASTTSYGADLAEAIEVTLGAPISGEFARASFPGWTYEGETGIACPECEGSLHLFGNSLTSRTGAPYRAMAVVCPEEGVVRLPHEHVRELDALKAWRDFRLVQEDADDAGKTDRSYWAYVIELDDEVGDRDGFEAWVYVGQTSRTPEERLQQHLDGYKASRWPRDHAVGLRRELYAEQPVLRTQAEALAYEAFLAERLKLQRYSVKGGH